MSIVERSVNGTPAGSRESVGLPEVWVRRVMRLLPESEATLLEMRHVRHLSGRAIARAMGMQPGTLLRRLRRLEQRVTDPRVLCILDPTLPIPEIVRRVGHLYLLENADLLAVARRLGIAPSDVRRHLNYLDAWQNGLAARGQRDWARWAER